MSLDVSSIKNAAGLVKSHTITQDSETTVMRTGKDMRETAQAIAAIENSCSIAKRRAVMGSVFGMRGTSMHYKDTSDTGDHQPTTYNRVYS